MTSANFAAAQQRVAARQQARTAAAEARIAQQRNEAAAGPLRRLPSPFAQAVLSLKSQWDSIKGRDGTRPAFRVGQVDAELLDEELLELFKGQVGEALKYYGPHLRDDWIAEIMLGVRSILFKLTLWDHDASYGAALQNLRYTDAREKSLVPTPPQRWQKALYGLFSVGGRYAWEKWETYLADIEGSYDEEPSPLVRLLSRFSSLASNTHSIVAFASFLVFLVDGKYRTILDRILRLRLLPTTSHVSREVSFEYLNRQLVWHAFTEFLLFILPLVGISRWKRWIARCWRKIRSTLRPSTSEQDNEDTNTKGELHFLPERTCGICYQDQNPTSAAEGEIAAIAGASSGVIGSAATDITNPYEALPCGCVYCFVCLAQRVDAEDGEGWTCLRCGEIVKECRPWHGDVVQEASRPSSGKSVSFTEDTKGPDDHFERLDPMPVRDEEEERGEPGIERDVDETSHEESGSDVPHDSERWTGACTSSSEDEAQEHLRRKDLDTVP